MTRALVMVLLLHIFPFSAGCGGDDIYGASLSIAQKKIVSRVSSGSISSVLSDPLGIRM